MRRLRGAQIWLAAAAAAATLTLTLSAASPTTIGPLISSDGHSQGQLATQTPPSSGSGQSETGSEADARLQRRHNNQILTPISRQFSGNHSNAQAGGDGGGGGGSGGGAGAAAAAGSNEEETKRLNDLLVNSTKFNINVNSNYPPFLNELLSSDVQPQDFNLANFSSGQEIQVLELNIFEATSLGYFRYPPAVSVIITIGYTCVFIIGLVGNSFVVCIVYKSPRMRTVTNYFIANLALADILVLLFCLPATLIGNLFIPYVLGLYVCKTVSYLQGVAVSASINTMVAVTIDRFLAICFPLDWHMSRRVVRRVIASIWLFSLAIAAPWAIYFNLVAYPMSNDSQPIAVCAEDWPSEMWGRIYFVGANLIINYLFPALVITICYLGIWYKIERRDIPGDRPKGLKIELIMQKSKLKVIKMMMVVVLFFLVSWLPTYLLFARLKLFPDARREPWEDWIINNVMPLAQWLGASNSCINPILYTFFNRKYKRGFRDLLCFVFCCKPFQPEALNGTSSGANVVGGAAHHLAKHAKSGKGASRNNSHTSGNSNQAHNRKLPGGTSLACGRAPNQRDVKTRNGHSYRSLPGGGGGSQRNQHLANHLFGGLLTSENSGTTTNGTLTNYNGISSCGEPGGGGGSANGELSGNLVSSGGSRNHCSISMAAETDHANSSAQATMDAAGDFDRRSSLPGANAGSCGFHNSGQAGGAQLTSAASLAKPAARGALGDSNARSQSGAECSCRPPSTTAMTSTSRRRHHCDCRAANRHNHQRRRHHQHCKCAAPETSDSPTAMASGEPAERGVTPSPSSSPEKRGHRGSCCCCSCSQNETNKTCKRRQHQHQHKRRLRFDDYDNENDGSVDILERRRESNQSSGNIVANKSDKQDAKPLDKTTTGAIDTQVAGGSGRRRLKFLSFTSSNKQQQEQTGGCNELAAANPNDKRRHRQVKAKSELATGEAGDNNAAPHRGHRRKRRNFLSSKSLAGSSSSNKGNGNDSIKDTTESTDITVISLTNGNSYSAHMQQQQQQHCRQSTGSGLMTCDGRNVNNNNNNNSTAHELDLQPNSNMSSSYDLDNDDFGEASAGRISLSASRAAVSGSRGRNYGNSDDDKLAQPRRRRQQRQQQQQAQTNLQSASCSDLQATSLKDKRHSDGDGADVARLVPNGIVAPSPGRLRAKPEARRQDQLADDDDQTISSSANEDEEDDDDQDNEIDSRQDNDKDLDDNGEADDAMSDEDGYYDEEEEQEQEDDEEVESEGESRGWNHERDLEASGGGTANHQEEASESDDIGDEEEEEGLLFGSRASSSKSSTGDELMARGLAATGSSLVTVVIHKLNSVGGLASSSSSGGAQRGASSLALVGHQQDQRRRRDHHHHQQQRHQFGHRDSDATLQAETNFSSRSKSATSVCGLKPTCATLNTSGKRREGAKLAVSCAYNVNNDLDKNHGDQPAALSSASLSQVLASPPGPPVPTPNHGTSPQSFGEIQFTGEQKMLPLETTRDDNGTDLCAGPANSRSPLDKVASAAVAAGDYHEAGDIDNISGKGNCNSAELPTKHRRQLDQQSLPASLDDRLRKQQQQRPPAMPLVVIHSNPINRAEPGEGD